jgi:hypothetical protein
MFHVLTVMLCTTLIHYRLSTFPVPFNCDNFPKVVLQLESLQLKKIVKIQLLKFCFCTTTLSSYLLYLLSIILYIFLSRNATFFITSLYY